MAMATSLTLAILLALVGQGGPIPSEPMQGDLGVATFASLPGFPDLDQALEGKRCIVHYTLSGPNASPGFSYVKSIQRQIDKQAKRMLGGKFRFRQPIYEPAAGDEGDKLHVFVGHLGELLGDPGNTDTGATFAVQQVPGSFGAFTVFSMISSGLRQPGDKPKVWKRAVSAESAHQFMHCIQFAYNAMLDTWALESQAVWAEVRSARVATRMLESLEHRDSVFNRPELPIWSESPERLPGVAVLWLHLQAEFGATGVRAFLEESESLGTTDALTVLEILLLSEGVATFDSFYKGFLASLYKKEILRIPKKKLPDMAIQGRVDQYGFAVSGQVQPTGAHVYELTAEADISPSPLFCRVSVEGGSGSPSGVLVHGKNGRLVLSPGDWARLEGFGLKKNQRAVLIVTDTDHDASGDEGKEGIDPTPYRAEAITPFFVLHDVTVPSPVEQENAFGVFTFTYDLLGVHYEQFGFNVLIEDQWSGPPGSFISGGLVAFGSWQPGRGLTEIVEYFTPFPIVVPPGLYEHEWTLQVGALFEDPIVAKVQVGVELLP